MQIITKNISELKSYEKNIRLHGDRQIKEYIRSIEMFGQIRPMIIDENNIVLCGNGLLQALQQMGKETGDCYVVKNLSENQKKKLMLSDNKIYELGVNNSKVFDEILQELDGDFDLPGYDEELLKVLTANARQADEVLNSYGKLSQEKITQMSNATPITNTPPFQTENQPATISENSIQTSMTTGTIAQNEMVQSGQKFVICPKCGEKIWL